MFQEEKFSLLDFDIYSRRISFFYRNKEKIGSEFGFILTMLYAIISIILFLVYFIKTIKREEVTASDSTIYPTGIPEIMLNKDNFYIAFGLEDPIKLTRFVDERIYYPEVALIERIKENGQYKKINETILKLERCNKTKFGKEYQYLFNNEEFNNSYCLQDFNLNLIGGFKYDRMSYIRINIFTCVNDSKNNNNCKSQAEIDKYINSGYFSALIKDVGLNPFNYSYPTIPIVQDLYTTIDKSTKKEFLIYYGITEINTDIGLFTNRIKKEIHLKYINDISNIFYLDKEEYNSGNEIFSAQIRLGGNIHYQKRTYTKMSVVFSITGGYMQVIYTILALIALVTKKFSVEKKLLNSLFNYNIKQKKIILSIEYEKKLGYNSSLNKEKENNFIPYEAKKSIVSNKIKLGRRNSIFLFNRKNNLNNIAQAINDKTEMEEPISKKERKNTNTMLNNNLINIIKNITSEKEEDNPTATPYQNNNRSSVNMIDNSNLNNLQINGILGHKELKKFNVTMINNIRSYDKGNCAIIKFNIFDYYCLRKITKKGIQIELFNFGINFYKSQMDIINFFNIIILTQIMLTQQSEKKHNMLSQTIELSMK